MAKSPFNVSGEQITRMVRILSDMPPVKPQELIKTPKEKCLCGKIVDVTQLEALDTGVFKTLNDVCRGCKDGHKIDAELARIVCARCKRVLLRVKPAKDKTGFEFKANKTYHVSECSVCDPDIEKCPIIEKVLWDRQHRVH